MENLIFERYKILRLGEFYMALGITIGFEIGEDGKPHLVMNQAEAVKTERKEKGKSLVTFPDDYTVIDIETTGLSPDWDEIIELAAIRYVKGTKTAEYLTLVHPENAVDEYITELTGITNEMLADAPTINDCIGAFANFVSNSVLVGYNVNFDINFIYDNLVECLGKPLSNDYVDVMRIARKELPDLKHHRQSDVAEFFNIKTNHSHRALYDCETCNRCFTALMEHIVAGGTTLDNFCMAYLSRHGKDGVHARDIKSASDEFDKDHPLYGAVCVFTGTLEKMTRAGAMQLVANLGGIPADGVTKKTNFLILGNNDYCKTIKDGKSSKQKKAEKLILDGADLQIIPEQVFYDMLTEN